MIEENESVCSECWKTINDDTETKWSEEAEPYCEDCFKEIKKDEYELLRFFVKQEILTYKNQLAYYNEYEPYSKENIKNTIIYIKRLELLENKLNLNMNS